MNIWNKCNWNTGLPFYTTAQTSLAYHKEWLPQGNTAYSATAQHTPGITETLLHINSNRFEQNVVFQQNVTTKLVTTLDYHTGMDKKEEVYLLLS